MQVGFSGKIFAEKDNKPFCFAVGVDGVRGGGPLFETLADITIIGLFTNRMQMVLSDNFTDALNF